MLFRSRVHAVCVLVLPIAVAAAVTGCGGGQAPPPRAEGPPPAGLSPSAQQMLGLLPGTGVVPGWSRTGEAQVFGAGNLWEFIDGAAETYLGFGFEDAVSAGYRHESGLEATVDIYRMADVRGAYGIYAQELDPKAEFLPIGAEGYLGGNVLNFWSGLYYVKITAPAPRDGLGRELQALAAHVTGGTGEAPPPPPETGYFPSRGLVPHSIKYVPKDLLGQSYLAGGFEARYQDGPAAYALVMVTCDSPQAARDALARYRAFVAASGTVRADPSRPGEGGFIGDAEYYGTVMAIRSGPLLVIALGTPTDAAAARLIEALLKQVESAA